MKSGCKNKKAVLRWKIPIVWSTTSKVMQLKYMCANVYMENDKNTISLGKVVIGTVKGDLHDIGKNLVSSMLEGCGFEVINLGVDVSDEKFVEAAKEHKANIVCMSALLTTTMVYMKEVIKAFEKAGIRKS